MPTLAINRVGAIEIGRDAAHQTYFGSLSVKISIFWIAGGLTSNSTAFAISAAATLPLRCASRPASSLNVSKIANDDGPSWIANQVDSARWATALRAYWQRVTLSSGRFAMIDDGLGFQLVPWRPALEQRLERQVSGAMMPGGRVDWEIG